MSESLDALERRVRAAVERAKAKPQASINAQLRGQRRQPPRATKRVRNDHVKMLVSASKSHLRDVAETMREIGEAPFYSDQGFDSLVYALKSSQDAFTAYQLATTSVVEDLVRERDELRDALGDQTAGKRAKRREAAEVVKLGAVSLRTVGDGYVMADVRDGSKAYRVERHGTAWSCSCGAGDCKHARSVQLCVYRTAAEPVGPDADAKTLAASGAVWVRMHDEQNSGLAEVVEGGKVFTLAKHGYGGYSGCGCGSLNGRCIHGNAIRVVLGR